MMEGVLLLLALFGFDSVIHAYDCDITINSTTEKSGYFESPNYPLRYPKSAVCKYTFTGTETERVQISFPKFNLTYPRGDPRAPKDCRNADNVKVLVGPDETDDLIGEYCGEETPHRLMSSDTEMTVLFSTTDRESTRSGFKGKFRFVQDFGIKTGDQSDDHECVFDYRSSKLKSGTFSSPNYPGFYPRDTECQYRFHGVENERVRITFSYFKVEGIYPGCQEESHSDFVEFSNFKTVKDDRMERLCGDLDGDYMTQEKISEGTFFRMTFKTNHIYEKSGFKATYEFSAPNSPDSTQLVIIVVVVVAVILIAAILIVVIVRRMKG